MGFFRFFLAAMVLISHMGINVLGINPGVCAVVVFYLLAGQVVCKLWQRQADLAFGSRIRWFYRDRIWRIAPMYGYVLLLGMAAWLLGAESYFMSATPGLIEWANNLLVIPLNYFMFNGSDTFTLLPPAWSLAAEIQFYVLVPFLLTKTRRVALAWAASLAVFLAAQTPMLNTDVFGYRLLAGIGFVFICGCWLAARKPLSLANPRQIALFGLWLMVGLYAAALWAIPAHREPFNLEVALGLFFGLPAVIALSRWRPQGRLHGAQRLAGALSYGIFLAHFPVMWLLELWRPELAGNVLAVLAGSTVVALGGHYGVERPLWAHFRDTVVPPTGKPA